MVSILLKRKYLKNTFKKFKYGKKSNFWPISCISTKFRVIIVIFIILGKLIKFETHGFKYCKPFSKLSKWKQFHCVIHNTNILQYTHKGFKILWLKILESPLGNVQNIPWWIILKLEGCDLCSSLICLLFIIWELYYMLIIWFSDFLTILITSISFCFFSNTCTIQNPIIPVISIKKV